MDTTRAFLDTLYEQKLSQDFDRIIIVLGDEGVGKSTVMLQLDWFWRDVVPDLEPSVDSVVGDIAWDRNDFKKQLSDQTWYTPILVHDATRILSKKKAMHSEQVELEEDLFDSRGLRKFMLLGYQEWDAVPTVLQERRAQNTVHVTSRGKFKVYGRKQMDTKVDKGSWPPTNFVDTFEALDGTQLWSAFRDKDLAKKQERIEPDSEEDAMDEDELAKHIIETNLDDVINFHGNTGEPYVDADLIKMHYDTSVRASKRIKKYIDQLKAKEELEA